MKREDYYKVFLLYIKMGETTHYQRNREMVLNTAKDWYENNKEVLREKAKISIVNYVKKRRIYI